MPSFIVFGNGDMHKNFFIRKVAVLGAGVMGAQIAAHLINANVNMPETVFLGEKDLTLELGEHYLQTLSTPLVMKAPNSSFSMYVERVHSPQNRSPRRPHVSSPRTV